MMRIEALLDQDTHLDDARPEEFLDNSDICWRCALVVEADTARDCLAQGDIRDLVQQRSEGGVVGAKMHKATRLTIGVRECEQIDGCRARLTPRWHKD